MDGSGLTWGCPAALPYRMDDGSNISFARTRHTCVCCAVLRVCVLCRVSPTPSMQHPIFSRHPPPSLSPAIGENVAFSYISCPADPGQALGIKLPFLVLVVKNVSPAPLCPMCECGSWEVTRQDTRQRTKRSPPFPSLPASNTQQDKPSRHRPLLAPKNTHNDHSWTDTSPLRCRCWTTRASSAASAPPTSRHAIGFVSFRVLLLCATATKRQAMIGLVFVPWGAPLCFPMALCALQLCVLRLFTPPPLFLIYSNPIPPPRSPRHDSPRRA